MGRLNPNIVRARVDNSPGSVGISRGCKYVALHGGTDCGSRSCTISLTPGQARRLAWRLLSLSDPAPLT